jgi:hypothetical protein
VPFLGFKGRGHTAACPRDARLNFDGFMSYKKHQIISFYTLSPVYRHLAGIVVPYSMTSVPTCISMCGW